MQLSSVFLLIYIHLIFASEDWEKFKTTYGKTFQNPTEEGFRKQIFQKNLKLIEEQNRNYEQGLSSFSLKVNKLADRTTEEIHFSSQQNEKYIPEINAGTSSRTLPRNAVPESIDWRVFGVISPVPNQEFCNSCWAFAVVGAVEAHMAIFRNEFVSLSQQNLVDCVTTNFTCNDYLDPTMLHNSYEYIISNGGIDSAGSYPYENFNVGACRFTPENVDATIAGYGNVTQDDEEELKVIVGSLGPVSVTITTPISWDLYSDGVYYNPDCMNTTDIFNHAVVVVGYGNEEGEDYWLVKNSWGTWFGDEGYIKMARNRENNCGIATMGRYPVML